MSRNMCKLRHKLRTAKTGVGSTFTWSNEAWYTSNAYLQKKEKRRRKKAPRSLMTDSIESFATILDMIVADVYWVASSSGRSCKKLQTLQKLLGVTT